MRGHLWSVDAVIGLALALTAALFANVSIVGLNQCCDVDIDRINKPYLPLASGEWSLQTGWLVTWVTAVAAVAIAAASRSTPLLATVLGSLLLGVMYSYQAPFLRWKRSPVAAAACIITVRSLLVQGGFWAHMHVARGAESVPITANLLFMVAFLAFFSIVIALFKDIPDVRGDEGHDVRTASVRFGVSRVFRACVGMLHCAYATAAVYIAATTSGVARVVLIATQLAAAWLLHRRASATDLQDHGSLVATYMFIWQLFYAQYAVFPLLA